MAKLKKTKSSAAGLVADLKCGAIHKFSDDAHNGIKFETTDLPCEIVIKDVPVEMLAAVYQEFLLKSFAMIKEGKVAYEEFLQELNTEEDEDESEEEEDSEEEEEEEDEEDEEEEEEDEKKDEADEDDEEDEEDDTEENEKDSEEDDEEDEEEDDEEDEEEDDEEEDDEEDELKTKVKLSKKELAAIMDFLTLIKLSTSSKELAKNAKKIKKAKGIKACNKKQKEYIKIAYQQRADTLAS